MGLIAFSAHVQSSLHFEELRCEDRSLARQFFMTSPASFERDFERRWALRDRPKSTAVIVDEDSSGAP
ncbi:MAG: hypothetical protein AUK47_16800 [Deltaproteobacteria bacterium CG2_30_63_29]|nr:MAG: hypothetical protein AUK47_16800 [Deltaproteobacteria bacterium CG2_30_63_29]